jgi:hypothetical protein
MRSRSGTVLLIAVGPMVATAVWAILDKSYVGVGSPELLATTMFGQQGGRFLRHCPPALVTYLSVALMLRHIFAVAIATSLRRHASQRPFVALTAAIALWLIIASSCAFLVDGITNESGHKDWSLAVGRITAVSGLPTVAAATLCAVVFRRASVYGIAVSCVTALLALFSLGLSAENIPVGLPGRLDVALVSGRATLQREAMVAALGWVAMAYAGCALATFRRRSAPELLLGGIRR